MTSNQEAETWQPKSMTCKHPAEAIEVTALIYEGATKPCVIQCKECGEYFVPTLQLTDMRDALEQSLTAERQQREAAEARYNKLLAKKITSAVKEAQAQDAKIAALRLQLDVAREALTRSHTKRKAEHQTYEQWAEACLPAAVSRSMWREPEEWCPECKAIAALSEPQQTVGE